MNRLLPIAMSLSLAVALACDAAPANGRPPQPAAFAAQAADRAAQVDALMAPWRDTPGAAILVVRDGRVLLSKGYGLANVETKAPIAPDTVFELASVSKQFTAMAIMILAERGVLSLDDPLTRFFPEFPAYGQKITVRNLLGHTGGLPDYMDAFNAAGRINKDDKPGGYEPTSADAVKILSEQKKPDFAAGEKWGYSNSGYAVLGQIVGKASGKPLPLFLKDNVFIPLGMTHTLMSEEARPNIPGRAVSYELKAGKYENIDYTPLNRIYGDGSVNTTIEDMYRWDQALYGEKLVKGASLRQAFTSGKRSNGEDTGYGFGWTIDKYHGLDRVSHGGGWVGFRTQIMRFPQAHFSVVVLSNLASFTPGNIARQVAAIYMPETFAPPPVVKVDPAVLQTYVGEYALGPTFILTVTLKAGVLRAQATRQGELALAATGPADFYVVGDDTFAMTFNADREGKVTGVTLHQNGDRSAKKIK